MFSEHYNAGFCAAVYTFPTISEVQIWRYYATRNEPPYYLVALFVFLFLLLFLPIKYAVEAF